jgi:hypothetical protein
MMGAVRTYWQDLSAALGDGWNRFWFTPASARALGLMRFLTGLIGLYTVATYAPDLERWFGPHAMLPLSLVRELYRAPSDSLIPISQFSIFDYLPPSMLWPTYWATLAVLALYTIGIGGRLMAIAAAVLVLSFFSRAPMVTGEFETIFVILLVYLCVGRSSDEFSLLAVIRKRSSDGEASRNSPATPSNNIALRLLQIHFAAVHLLIGWGMLAGPEGSWWSGEGIWLAAMRPGMSLVDFSFLVNHPRVVAAWSHVITLYALAFPVFAWIRLARPILLAVGVFVWVSLALASGWVMFCLAMLTGLIAFLDFDRASDLTASAQSLPNIAK